MSRRRPAPHVEADARRIVRVYCRRHGITRADLTSHARRYSAHRRTVWRLLRLEGLSYPAIGWLMDRDHSAIVAAIPNVPRGYLRHDLPCASPDPTRSTTPESTVVLTIVKEVPVECTHPDMIRLPLRIRDNLTRVARATGRSPDVLAALILDRQLAPVVARLVDTPSGASGNVVRDATKGHRTTPSAPAA